MNTQEKTTAFMTILRKEVQRFLRIWPQTLLPSAITMILYFIIFGKFIGSQIRGMQGFTYIEFIVPGLIMMAVITNSYSNVVSSFFGSKFQKSVEELLVSPAPNYIILFGYCAGGILRGLLVGFIVSITSLFFVKIRIFSVFFIIVFIFLTSLMFSLAGFMNGVFAGKFDDISIVPTFILTPLIYLGGVFYSISLLPGFWQTMSKANPILYMVNGFRFGFLGITDINIYIALSILAVFIIALFSANMYFLKKGTGIKD